MAMLGVGRSKLGLQREEKRERLRAAHRRLHRKGMKDFYITRC